MNELDDATHITNPSAYPVDIPATRYVQPMRSRAPIIDWDAASVAWHQGKIRRGDRYYYRCTAIQRNGQQCPKPDLQPVAGSHVCKMHRHSKTQVPLQTENH